MPPPSSARRSIANAMLAVGHADDDEVVRVVRDARRERAALQPRARHEAEPDPARREVPLDDRDLREVVLGARDRVPAFDDGLALERLGHDLIRRRGRSRASSLRSTGSRSPTARPVRSGRTGAPTRGPPRRGTSSIGRPSLQHRRRLEAHEVGEEQEIGDVPGRDRAVLGEAVPDGGMVRCHEQRVLRGDAGARRPPGPSR